MTEPEVRRAAGGGVGNPPAGAPARCEVYYHITHHISTADPQSAEGGSGVINPFGQLSIAETLRMSSVGRINSHHLSVMGLQPGPDLIHTAKRMNMRLPG